MDLTAKLNELLARYEALNQRLLDPTITSNPRDYQKVSKEHSDLTPAIEKINLYRKTVEDMKGAEELMNSGDAEMSEMASAEHSELEALLPTLEQDIKLLLLPRDPRDEKNIILEIRAGAGGDEAALFAANLFRMYAKFAESRRWKVEVMDSNPTGIGGMKEIVASIQGKGVYGMLKYESGVHRVQRVPATETQGRIHTSTATVAVLPEAEEVDVKVDEKDLRVDTFCASGPGGQGVNTTYSAVRIVHIPTGLIVSCQDSRSQIKNRESAMKVLRARLYELELAAREKERSDNRRAQVGTGDRSERIRTYNYPQNRITDHRAGITLYKLDLILEGVLEELLTSLHSYFSAEALKALA